LKVWKNSSSVVDQKHVEVAVAALKLLRALRAQGGDELSGEGLRGRVADTEARSVGGEVVGDRHQEVGLAESGWAVEEERVVGLGWSLRDGQRGGMSDPVPLADHEAVEGVVDVEIHAGGGIESFASRIDIREADVGQLGSSGADRLADQPGVAPLGPCPDALGGREIEDAGLGTDDGQRLQPELKCRRRHGSTQTSADVLPEGVEIVFRRVAGHQRPTIAAAGRAKIGPPANPEERFQPPSPADASASVYCDAR
jgi:hypothetical protein